MYKTYGELYRNIQRKKNVQDYFSDIQPCNKNIPTASIVCSDYLPGCKTDSVNSSTNNTLNCRPRGFHPDYPYRSFIYNREEKPQREIDEIEDGNTIEENYKNISYNPRHIAYQYINRTNYKDLDTLYNPKFN